MRTQRKSLSRQDALLQSLRDHREMSVDEVAEKLAISVPTARRLCTKLANENLVIRTHGGVRSLPAGQMTYSFEKVQNEEALEKIRIAQHACRLVENGQTLFLEAGTTVLQFAIALAGRIERGELSNLIVYTNSLSTLEVLESVTTVNLIGGEYRPTRRDFSGFISERIVRGLRFDLCFTGCDAINCEDGVMAQDISTAQFDELLVMRSTKSYVLAQSAKFSRLSLISYASLSGVTAIITDDHLSQALRVACRSVNGNVELAPMNPQI